MSGFGWRRDVTSFVSVVSGMSSGDGGEVAFMLVTNDEEWAEQGVGSLEAPVDVALLFQQGLFHYFRAEYSDAMVAFEIAARLFEEAGAVGEGVGV